MKETIIDMFTRSGQIGIQFSPAIRIKMTPHSETIWIDSIYKVRENYMLKVSTRSDNMVMNLNSVGQEYLSSLSIRLYGMYGKLAATSK